MINTKLSRRSFLGTLAAGSATLAAPGILRSAYAADSQLNVLSYPGFIPASFREKFEAETGIRLNVKETDQSHVVFNTLVADAGRPTTDVVVTVGHLLPRFTPSQLLKPLDLSRLPSWDRIRPAFSKSDWLNFENGTWGVPLLMGFQTLAWNKELEPAHLDSWGAIFDEKYKGKITWRLNDFLYYALSYLGYDQDLVEYIGDDDKARAVVAEATDFVIAHKPLIRKFYDSNAELEQLFVNEEIIVTHARNGMIGSLLQNGFPIAYEIPKEGAGSFVYNWSLTNGAANEDNAYRFLEAVLAEPGLGSELQLSSGYLSTFEGTEEGSEGKVATLTDEQLSRAKFYRIENADLKDKLFAEAEARINAA